MELSTILGTYSVGTSMLVHEASSTKTQGLCELPARPLMPQICFLHLTPWETVLSAISPAPYL